MARKSRHVPDAAGGETTSILARGRDQGTHVHDECRRPWVSISMTGEFGRGGLRRTRVRVHSIVHTVEECSMSFMMSRAGARSGTLGA